MFNFLVWGNHDLNTIYHAVELFKQGLAPYLVITCDVDGVTNGLWTETEADKFARIAIERGVFVEKIATENKSTNTGENYAFTKKILDEKGIVYNKAILVTKPYMERRAYATAKVHWPNVDLIPSSVPMSLEEYLNAVDAPEKNIHLMVGDLQRIRLYPTKRFQIPQDIPDDVWAAFEFLVACGYDNRLIKNRRRVYKFTLFFFLSVVWHIVLVRRHDRCYDSTQKCDWYSQ